MLHLSGGSTGSLKSLGIAGAVVAPHYGFAGRPVDGNFLA
jgi:hypothetical protein